MRGMALAKSCAGFKPRHLKRKSAHKPSCCPCLHCASSLTASFGKTIVHNAAAILANLRVVKFCAIILASLAWAVWFGGFYAAPATVKAVKATKERSLKAGIAGVLWLVTAAGPLVLWDAANHSP